MQPLLLLLLQPLPKPKLLLRRLLLTLPLPLRLPLTLPWPLLTTQHTLLSKLLWTLQTPPLLQPLPLLLQKLLMTWLPLTQQSLHCRTLLVRLQY
jgi:hypothetical protein